MKEFTTESPECSEKIVCSNFETTTESSKESCHCSCCCSTIDNLFAAVKNTVFPPDDADFSIPLLSRIFYIFGFIALAVIPVILIYALCEAVADNGKFAIFLALCSLAMILKALIYWGIAQYFYYIAKTSSNTNKIVAMMKK